MTLSPRVPPSSKDEALGCTLTRRSPNDFVSEAAALSTNVRSMGSLWRCGQGALSIWCRRARCNNSVTLVKFCPPWSASAASLSDVWGAWEKRGDTEGLALHVRAGADEGLSLGEPTPRGDRRGGPACRRRPLGARARQGAERPARRNARRRRPRRGAQRPPLDLGMVSGDVPLLRAIHAFCPRVRHAAGLLRLQVHRRRRLPARRRHRLCHRHRLLHDLGLRGPRSSCPPHGRLAQCRSDGTGRELVRQRRQRHRLQPRQHTGCVPVKAVRRRDGRRNRSGRSWRILLSSCVDGPGSPERCRHVLRLASAPRSRRLRLHGFRAPPASECPCEKSTFDSSVL